MLRPVAAIFSLFVLLCGCTQSPVSTHIGEQARTQGKVELAAIVDFEWDTVFIFSPYATNTFICKAIGTHWPDCERLAPQQVAESEYHLVFINQGSFVMQVVHSRMNGDFCKQTCALSIRRENAIFNVVPYSSKPNEANFYLFTKVAP